MDKKTKTGISVATATALGLSAWLGASSLNNENDTEERNEGHSPLLKQTEMTNTVVLTNNDKDVTNTITPFVSIKSVENVKTNETKTFDLNYIETENARPYGKPEPLCGALKGKSLFPPKGFTDADTNTYTWVYIAGQYRKLCDGDWNPVRIPINEHFDPDKYRPYGYPTIVDIRQIEGLGEKRIYYGSTLFTKIYNKYWKDKVPTEAIIHLSSGLSARGGRDMKEMAKFWKTGVYTPLYDEAGSANLYREDERARLAVGGMLASSGYLSASQQRKLEADRRAFNQQKSQTTKKSSQPTNTYKTSYINTGNTNTTITNTVKTNKVLQVQETYIPPRNRDMYPVAATNSVPQMTNTVALTENTNTSNISTNVATWGDEKTLKAEPSYVMVKKPVQTLSQIKSAEPKKIE